MSNALFKSINTTYIPGTPGVPASPGQPWLPARTVYEDRTVCTWRAETSGGSLRWAQDENGEWVQIASGGTAATTYVYSCRTERVPVYYPEQPYIPPTPGVAPVPSQFISDYNLGWTGGARSIASFNGNGYAAFRVPKTVTGAFVGLNDVDESAGYAEIDHTIYCSHGVARVYEGGVEKHYAGAYADTDVFKIRRRGGVVTYLKNDAVFYTSATPSSGTVFMDVSLYTGGDSVVDPVFLSESGSGASSGAFAPLYGAGRGMQFTEQAPPVAVTDPATFQPLTGRAWGSVPAGARSHTSFAPLTVLSRVAARSAARFEPLSGLGGDKRYGDGRAQLAPLTGTGSGGHAKPSYAISDGVFVMLRANGSGLTGEIGGGQTSFAPLQGGIGSDHAYGESRGSFEALTGGGHAYLGAGEAQFFSASHAAPVFDAPVELYVAMNSRAEVVSVFAMGLALDAQIVSQATALTPTAVQAVLHALLYSTAGATTLAPLADSDTTVWVVNADTGGSTRYEQYAFNSFAKIGDSYYGARNDGLYRLDGNDDNGLPIQAMVAFGKQTFGTSALKRVTNAYLGVASTGKVFLKVLVEGEEYLYAARASSETLQTQRVDIGRGIRANYVEFEFYNADGDDFELASVEFVAAALNRRI